MCLKDISVIIPIYNVEKYLARCIDSVLNQQEVDYEIILVDDGSTDHSLEICNEYQKKESRIRIIHKENEGLGYARNSGIDVACGKYIFFLDSDDFIVEGALKKILLLAENNGVDLVSFEYIMTSRCIIDDSQIRRPKEEVVLNNREIMKEYFWRLSASACTKLYKRELFNNVRFSAVPLHEDAYTMHLILQNVSKAVVTNQIYYIQYIRENSLTQTKFTRKNFLCVECGNRIVKFAEKEYPELIQFAIYNLLERQIYTLNLIVRSRKIFVFRNEVVVLIEEMRKVLEKIDDTFLRTSNSIIQGVKIVKHPYVYIATMSFYSVVEKVYFKIKRFRGRICERN